jgi:hypothetical protein
VTRHEAEIVREAITDSLRVLADLGDVLTAVAAASRLCAESLTRVEQDLLAISSILDDEP